MSDASPHGPGQSPWPGNIGQPPWAGAARGNPGQDPFGSTGGQPPWGGSGPSAPPGPPPGFHRHPPVPRPGTSMADVLRNCTLRNGYVHDGLAALLLLIALFLPWNRFFSLVWNHAALITVALVLVTLLSLLSLTLPHLARLGVFGAGWTIAHTRITRLIANLPYLAFVTGFLLYDVVRGYFRLGSGGGAVSAGVGVAAWFGVAGAILAAQPRASELAPGTSPWLAASRYLLRTGLVLAIVSALTNVAAVFVSSGAPSGEAIKLLAIVLPAVVASAAVVGVAVLGLGHDFVSGRLVVGSFAVAALVAGFCLSFGYDTGNASSAATGGADSSSREAIPQPFYTERPPVLVVLDTSSSMDEIALNGSTRIAAARAAVDQLIDSLDSDRQFALMSFPGNGTVVDGCSTGELEIPFGSINPSSAHSTVARLVPDGETPTGPALTTAGNLIQRSVGGKGVIVLVSDGEYTCGPSPCAVARDLAKQGLQIQVNTVGFQISNTGADELQCIAKVTGGQYVPVQDQAQLQAAISNLSASGPRSGVPWLEYFHYDFGGPDRLGYLGVLLWVAAAAAMVNPGAHPLSGQDLAGAAYRWLFAASRLMLLVAIWDVGSAAVEAISAALSLNSLPLGWTVAHAALSIVTATASVVAVRALQPRRAHGIDPRPPRRLALALCGGTSLSAVVAAIVLAVAADGASVGLLDLVNIWLPAMVAAAIVGAPPIRALYSDRPLFAQQGMTAPGYPASAPGYAPSNSGYPPRAPNHPAPGAQDAFSVTYFQPPGPNTADPFSGNSFQPQAAVPPDPFSGNSFQPQAAVPPDPFSGNSFQPQSAVDPGLAPAELYRLAQARPDLRVSIANHPNADPHLLSWLGRLGDPAVANAVSQRLRRR